MTTLLNKIDNDTIVKPLVTGSPATRSADSTGKTKNQVTTALPQKKASDSIPRQKPITSLSTTFPSQKLVVTKEKQKEKVDTVVSAEIKKLPEKQVVKNTNPGLPTFFTHHELKLQHTNPLPIEKAPADWIFFSLFAILGAFTITKALHGKNIRQMRDAFFSTTMSNQIIRDENLLFQRASMFLTVVFYLASSLLLYHVSVVYHWQNVYLSTGFGRFFIFVLLISLIYSAKLIVLKAIGFILKIEKPVNIYIFNVFLVNNVVGVLLIPLLISLSYMDSYSYKIMLYLAFVLVATGYLYRLSRGVLMGVGNAKFSPYYIILYLCTLEIAPLLFFAKLLVK